jgi:hypothetical protein
VARGSFDRRTKNPEELIEHISDSWPRPHVATHRAGDHTAGSDCLIGRQAAHQRLGAERNIAKPPGCSHIWLGIRQA